MQIHHDFDLSQILWYKIGGKAKYFLQCENRQDILEALSFIEKHHPKRVFVCGLGSNLIFSDDYFDGVVIRISSNQKTPQILTRQDIATAFSGETLDTLIQVALNEKLTGLEWAGGLPGTVGAGVRGNVGAFGGEIKDAFISADVLVYEDQDFDIQTITKDDFHFAYRNSVIKEQNNLIVLSAKFALQPSDAASLVKARQTYATNIDYRKMHHPLEYPNCGSVFKNIKKPEEVEKVLSVWPDIRPMVEQKWHGKVSMGYINNRLGFSGYKIGNAQVSEKHANFIVNHGGATATEVRQIIKHIQDMTSEALSITPEVEVEIVE